MDANNSFKRFIVDLYSTNCFTVFMLCWMLSLERLVFNMISDCDYRVWWLIIGISFVLLILIGIYYKAYRFSLSIMKRFLNNALGLKWLSFIFILIFLVHISWLSDSCFNFFIEGKKTWGNILVSLAGIVCMFIIFPIQKRENKTVAKQERTLLISGIKEINAHFLDLFFKPFNVYPNIEKVVILLSDKVLSISNGLVDDVLLGVENEADEYKKAIKYYTTSPTELNRKVVQTKLSDFLLAKIGCSVNGYKDRNVNFVFSKVVDYNNFNDCFLELKLMLKNEENNTNETIINISPGTSIVSGTMTIFAIKGKRELVYTRQDNSKLESFDIDIWTTEDLLNELWGEIETSEK